MKASSAAATFLSAAAAARSYASLVAGFTFFFFFNSYLHCGYTLETFEYLFPRVLLNSSAFHNVHHEKVVKHFGEISSLWDYLCGTARIYDGGLKAGYQWHVLRGMGAEAAKAY